MTINTTTAETMLCSNCNSINIIKDNTRGEYICTDCGTVHEERLIDQGPEYRIFNNEEGMRRSRTGSPTTLVRHDKGLQTTINLDDKDIYGNKISHHRKAQIYRMRKWNRRTARANATERNLSTAMMELSHLSSQLGLPQSVAETASIIYRKSLDYKISRGRDIELMITAVLYASTRIRRVPRTLGEISKNSKFIKKDISRCYRLIVKELKLYIPIPDPNDYLIRIAAELSVTGKVILKAKNIIQIAKEQKITIGKTPSGLAASALYIACITEDERRTQREIADKANVTEVTIRNRYKELVKNLKFL